MSTVRCSALRHRRNHLWLLLTRAALSAHLRSRGHVESGRVIAGSVGVPARTLRRPASGEVKINLRLDGDTASAAGTGLDVVPGVRPATDAVLLQGAPGHFGVIKTVGVVPVAGGGAQRRQCTSTVNDLVGNA